MNRNEIRENRIKWAEFLMEPGRLSAKGVLEKAGTEQRCCLGHACYIFNIEKTSDIETISYENNVFYAPESISELLGLWSEHATTKNCEFSIGINGINWHSLSSANDTGIEPYQIGEYILTVIEGGHLTPFRPLTEYSE